MRQRQGNPFLLLTFFSAATLAVILLLTVRSGVLSHKKPAQSAAEIAIEHNAAMTVTVGKSSGRRDGIVEFIGEGADFRLSVPFAWKRREVRGTELSAVRADPPAMGFTRWHVPKGATLSFRVIGSPSLTVRNVSTAPLLFIGKKADMKTGHVEESSFMLNGGAARLW
ncbi:hypothetical protein HYW84_04175 [Candidatus Peregrinibacteria bacterium]|nr:hypothetical protein [Candidatus Peregrinibacteria bacterium]